MKRIVLLLWPLALLVLIWGCGNEKEETFSTNPDPTTTTEEALPANPDPTITTDASGVGVYFHHIQSFRALTSAH